MGQAILKTNGTFGPRGGVKEPATLAVVTVDWGDILDLFATDNVIPANATHHLRAQNKVNDSRDYGGPSWYGGLRSIAEARALVTDGWTEGAARAGEVGGALVNDLPAAQSIRGRWVYGPEGDDVSIERAMAGDYDVAYRRRVKVQVKGTRIINIAANYGGSCARSAEELFWTGVQLVVASDILESAGYRTELHGYRAQGPWSGKYAILDIVAKRPSEPLRIDALMAVLAHAGVFRTYGFAGICRFPWPVGYGLGPCYYDVRGLAERMADAGLLDRVDYIMPDAYNRESAIKNITALVGEVTQAKTGEATHE